MKFVINSEIEKLIEKYFSLNIAGKNIVCPYYINTKIVRGELGVLAGKGSPSEIEHEVRVWAKVRGIDLEKATEEEIRKFMISQHIGIDCSGFVANVFDEFLKSQKKGALIKYLKFENNSLISKIRRMLRPIENIGANCLTGPLNTINIHKLDDVRPGDLIRAKGAQNNAHHVAIITSVELGEDRHVKVIEYVHSHRFYGEANGMRKGKIEILDINQPLEKQNWSEVYTDGRNYIYEDYMVDLEDNGIRRLNFVDKIGVLKLWEEV